MGLLWALALFLFLTFLLTHLGSRRRNETHMLYNPKRKHIYVLYFFLLLCREQRYKVPLHIAKAKGRNVRHLTGQKNIACLLDKSKIIFILLGMRHISRCVRETIILHQFLRNWYMCNRHAVYEQKVESSEIVHIRPYFLQIFLRSCNLHCILSQYGTEIAKQTCLRVDVSYCHGSTMLENLKENPKMAFCQQQKLSFQCISNYLYLYLNDDFTK